MKKLLVLHLLLVLAALPLMARAQVNQWHPLTHLTPAQRQSASYKFLVSKFGAGHLLTECAPGEAAALGDDYLFQVMDDNSDGERHGQALGNGATLQQALDAAAANYLSPEMVKHINDEFARQAKEAAQREAEYRKRCCAVHQQKDGQP